MAYLDENGVETLAAELRDHADQVYVAQLLSRLYPIGSVYISVSSTNPGTLFGGTWEAIRGKVLIGESSDYTAGTTGGKANYTASDMPAHTHTRGTMEITGTVGPLDDTSCTVLTGSFYNAGSYSYDATSSGSGAGWKLGFKASDGWTGETSQSGTSATAEILPPYLAVYIWKRVA